jgi:hypothetical protein
MNKTLGGEDGSYYLVTADLGSELGQGLDFIGTCLSQFSIDFRFSDIVFEKMDMRSCNASTVFMIPPISVLDSPPLNTLRLPLTRLLLRRN